MNKAYTVFSANMHKTGVQATLPNGVVVNAIVDCLEVQLTADDGVSGTLKLAYTDPDEIVAAQAKFVVGESISATFA